MEEKTSTTEKVKAIWYKSIPEDQADCVELNENTNETKFSDHKSSDEIQEKFDKLMQASAMKNLKQNFTFEYSYPAVIFDKVCFHIDKYQQQANFLDECLFKLKSCIKLPGSSSAGSNTEKIEILKSINLSVPYGSIFGLLGPSSCGKTTLLRCLVGLLRPSSGSIRLFCECSEEFDEKNDSKDASYLNCCSRSSDDNLTRNRCKVPGPNVGYMPQDLGLYEDFTIRQLLTMFGQYMRMGSKLIANRIEFMVKFLDLPQVDREICSLSGGQKRRVSFAIACLHMPPLIILDEPTVGVDPLLRKSIWKYLRRLADEENKTIIITTHYIEEAAQADQVALMRAGEILVQDTPGRIMETNNCKTLEEAFLKICNNVQQQDKSVLPTIEQQQQQKQQQQQQPYKLYPQPKFTWHNNLQLPINIDNTIKQNNTLVSYDSYAKKEPEFVTKDSVASKAKVLEQLVVNGLKANVVQSAQNCDCLHNVKLEDKIINKFSMEPNNMKKELVSNNSFSKRKCELRPNHVVEPIEVDSGSCKLWNTSCSKSKYTIANATMVDKDTKRKRRKTTTKTMRIMGNGKSPICRGKKFVIDHDENGLDNSDADADDNDNDDDDNFKSISQNKLKQKFRQTFSQSELYRKLMKNLTITWALLYKNYRRNVNSLPLLAFQFMLPILQMISFSLCVGGRPTNIGLGLVNHDQPLTQFNRSHLLVSPLPLLQQPPIASISNTTITTTTTTTTTTSLTSINDTLLLTDQPNDPSTVMTNYGDDELLSDRYLSFVDQSMISIKHYDNLEAALNDVRRAKLWAAMEISENFTTAILRRFDVENFYQLDLGTIKQSVIRLYPDRSNKILDMICHRSLVNSYRQFLLEQFEQFKRLPIEIKEPIFSIKPNIISNSIDGYTESIAAGLLASLTYIMAAGLTTFIMVVERSAGILERTFTSGINPIAYLIAHAAFRSLVMMLQIGVVLFLTFYILQQPLVGSIWLAYVMLMTLNLTGISYGLLISSIVTDQNGAALTIVSSLVVKITLSGILWPFEAIPRWLRTICYIQPLTMPIQALKNITLKGADLQDRSVQLGFLVSLTWLLIFLTVSAKRFKFYQH